MRNEKGIYIVLLALLLFVLLGLVALALGLGMLGTSKTRLQNAANLAALAALERFSAQPLNDPYVLRANNALQRANEILVANTMPGVAANLGNLVHHGETEGTTTGGVITFGNWHSRPPVGGAPDPCATYGGTPCFVPNDDITTSPLPTTRVTAVRIEAHNPSGSPMIWELGRFLGKTRLSYWSTATATLAPRCTAYLMDVGDSISWETHPKYSPNQIPALTENAPPKPRNHPCLSAGGPLGSQCSPGCTPSGCNPTNPDEYQCFAGCNPIFFINAFPSAPVGLPPIPPIQPINFGVGAFRANYAPTHSACGDLNTFQSFLTKEQLYWCNYPRADDPRGPQYRSVAPDTLPFRHYQTDYEAEASPIWGVGDGQVLVDKLSVPGPAGSSEPFYDGPQPYTRNFLAFNAGLRQVQSTSVGGDVSMIMVFTGVIRDTVPATGFSSDLGYLIQLTNLDNRGKRDYLGNQVTPEIHPNFVDRGWAPYPGEGFDSRSGIGPALFEAAERLHSECPAASKKAILLASDGLANVRYDPIPVPVGVNTYLDYTAAKEQILTTPMSGPGGIVKPPILQLLKEYEISLSMIMDGSHVNPNFRNVASENTSAGCPPASAWSATTGFGTDNPKCYYSFQEAFANGYGGQRSTFPLFDWKNYNGTVVATDPDEAFKNAGSEPGWAFGDPMGLWSDVSLETGGFFCPLLPTKPGVITGNPTVDDYIDFFNDRAGARCDQPCTNPAVACSPCVLKSRFRNPGGGDLNVQKYSPEYLSKGEQAARCARFTVGLNPFTLVEKDN
jgi:hypothetical protein